jgi:hypothetical protein
MVDNEVSCRSCRKASKHCSFVDDQARRIQSGISNINELDVRSRGGRPGLSAASAVNPQPGSAGISEDGAFSWNPSNGAFDHDMGLDDLYHSDRVELSTFCNGTQSLAGLQDDQAITTPWMESSSEPSHHSRNGVPAPGISLYGISPQLQPPTTDVQSGNTHSTSAVGTLANSFPIQYPDTGHSPVMETTELRPSIGSPIERRAEPNSIDQRLEFHGSHFGLSGESDPYLLRHILYDESNEFPVIRVMYREAEPGLRDSTRHAWQTPELTSPTSTSQKAPVPVHFMLTANELGEEAQKVGPTESPGAPHSTKLELDGLVRDEHGRRLILL